MSNSPLRPSRTSPGTASVVGPVNGMSELDPAGSYYHVLVQRKDRSSMAVLLTELQLEDLISAGRRAIATRGLTQPCPSCGKPADTASCHMGGCPLGGDL